MHPVNGCLSGITSADFCGAASRWVEQAFGDEMVMVFTQGASGEASEWKNRLNPWDDEYDVPEEPLLPIRRVRAGSSH